MRTHATRHFDVTVSISQGKNFHGLVRCALLDRDDDVVRSSSRLSLHAQAERARELGGFRVVAEDEERGVGLAREAGEADGDRAREQGSAVEDDERERPAAEEHVGAPRAAPGFVGPHDPEAFASAVRADMGPVARGERAGGVDVGDPPAVVHRALGDPADEGGLAAAGRTDELGEPAAGEAAVREGSVEGEAGGEARRSRSGALDDFGEVLTEEG
jgi:hypothetical protein